MKLTMTPNLNDPKAISDAGKRIYNERYQREYERDYPGQFVAVDVLSGNATLGSTASETLVRARQQYPEGVFHLIRVGHSGAFEVGIGQRHVNPNRLPR